MTFHSIFENLSRKYRFHWNLIRISGTLHEAVCTFNIASRWLLNRMRNVSDRSSREKQNTPLYPITFFLFRKSYRLWENVEKHCRVRHTTDYNIILSMRITCWIPKATNTHSQYAILIALPQQQWVHGRSSKWRHTYSACLVKFYI